MNLDLKSMNPVKLMIKFIKWTYNPFYKYMYNTYISREKHQFFGIDNKVQHKK